MKINLSGLIMFLMIASIINNYIKDDPRQIPDIKEPIQTNISPAAQGGLRHIKKIGDWKITCWPLASYEISAKVIKLVPYFYGLDAVVSPYDIGVVWGRFKNDKDFKNLKAKQGSRVLNYEWAENYNRSYVVSHVANIHIIPKDNEMLKKIRKIRKGDDVYLKGYLVKVEGINMQTGKRYLKNTSLLRSNTEKDACETMYVTDIIYHHKKMFNLKEH